MDRTEDAGHEQKRLRLDQHLQRRLPRFTGEAKGKYVVEFEACLDVNIIGAIDIDREFRSVTDCCYYGVQGWINPGEEFHTLARRPNVFDSNLDPVWEEGVILDPVWEEGVILDPVWEEGFLMPLGETNVEDATLHLDVLRVSNVVLDPGNSSKRRLVGRAQFRLDQLQADEMVEMTLQLIQPGKCGWEPEGFILLNMQLAMIPS